MTSLSELRRQADKIAKNLKAIDRGETVTDDRDGKIAASRIKGEVKFAIIVNDKACVIEMTWASIRDSTEAALSAFVLKQLRDTETTH